MGLKYIIMYYDCQFTEIFINKLGISKAEYIVVILEEKVSELNRHLYIFEKIH